MPPIRSILPILLLGLAACHHQERSTATSAEYLVAPGAAASLPFSEAVRVDGLLILSGQIGVQPGTLQLVPGGIEPEARQTMDNIRATLSRNSLGMDDLVKCSVFLADMQDWPAFNQVYRSYFPRHFPARSALGANGLALGARVEVECIAQDRHGR